MDTTSNKVTVNIEDEMRQSYMDYAMSVIVGRALPDVRDGLKPVQRRILYAMLGEGLVSSRKHSKCAGVVGEVLKRLHPHGDMPVYDALVRLAQPWNLRYPLIDGQGNFGSIDGDSAAAYRYTECRLTALAEKILEDIEKETVEFAANFDDSNIEPVVLPSVVPNLLINGADGIAVGMATHIPPHNIKEVIDGTIALIKNPAISVDELMELIPGPDFPTGGIICGNSSIRAAYSRGKGVIQLRAKTHIETIKAKSRDAEAIIITEVPYQVNKARLIERIAELVNDRVIDGISKLRDESDRKGIRVVIELKRDATTDVVMNQLLKLTPMQTSFGVINLAITEGKPAVLTLPQMIRCFVDHRRDVVTRRTQFELRKARERMHLLEGFRIALLNLDEVIALIRGSQTPKDAKEGLIKSYKLSDVQAQAILDLRLQKLTGMERLAIENEHAELAKEIERLIGILADNRKVDEIIVGELSQIREKFQDARRTQIVEADAEIQLEDLIEDEEMAVTISHQGYIKRTAVSVYRSQKRGGRGVTGAATKDEDFTQHLFTASTLAYLLVFTSHGRLYWQKVHEIPETGRAARGRAIVNLLNLRPDEVPTAILPVREFKEGQSVFLATRQGTVKKVNLLEFSNPRRGGILACSLDKNDRLIDAGLCSGNDDIILATRGGISIRFSETDVRAMGRSARGVRGINLEEGDFVVGMTVVPGGIVPEGAALLTICENGFGKRTKIEDYRRQGRGGKGIIDIRTEGRNGPVVGVLSTNNDSQFMLITSSGKVIRILASDMSIIGRNTMGVRLINLDEGEKVASIAQLMEKESETA